ncbi:restriction endonuclease [Tolypothrix sp. PCC 7910]|uniref:restriction endonuclease n=1 Tax=Tolypothrix sp. PCC 7910 TaxID=2099387 RepID=UPI0014279453|nr:restriction endonuclease [Tolypothrix sp. PCC 7910]QIR38327.1 restriction endonuclease [Tolypothrix sp. PCC 7910]
MKRNIPSQLMKDSAKQCARAHREAEIAKKRAAQKSHKLLQPRKKQSGLNYLEQRLTDVDEINAEIADWIGELQTILEHTLAVEDTISFDNLRIRDTFPAMETPQQLSIASPQPQFQKPPSLPHWLMQRLPFLERRYQKALRNAESNYQIAKQKYEEKETSRQLSLERLKANYEWHKHTAILETKKRNAEVDELEEAYQDRAEAAVVLYNEMVLERSEYPLLEDLQYISYTDENKVAFPQQFQVAYFSAAKQLVIDYELPTWKIIPTIAEVRYDGGKDEIYGIPRTLREIEELYQNLIAAITLRTISEVFAADLGQHLDFVVFNGFVQKLDFNTKKHIPTNLISVRVSKDSFSNLNFSTIDTLTCLRKLGAQVSSHLTAIQPVQSITELNIVNEKVILKEDIG